MDDKDLNKITKTNNKFCSLRSFSYDEKKQELKVIYRGSFKRIIFNFTKEDYEKLKIANTNKKLLMPVLKKIQQDKNKK